MFPCSRGWGTEFRRLKRSAVFLQGAAVTFQMPEKEGLAQRMSFLRRARRVVVKVGSAVLTGADGLHVETMASLVGEVAMLRGRGIEVILVSSGAVAAGRRIIGDRAWVSGLKEKQAAAAVGQSGLMRTYEDLFGAHDLHVAQLLLTHDDLASRRRYLNVRNTVLTLLSWGVVPIINENDTVSVSELRFGDNDNLAAQMTNLTEADLFVCLTDVEGLFTANPALDPSAVKVLTVARIDRRIEAMAGNVRSAMGTGGMRSKIRAARMVSARGGCSFIGPGRRPGILASLFAGEPVGTFFLPKADRMASRKHWIAYTLRPKGYLVLDDGACRALVERKKSLLPAGITEVRGRFGVGAPVHCLDASGRAFAAGLVNYRSSDIEKIMGARTSDIENILGFRDSDEVIHRDNLVIL